jgi:hypothetical protein
MPRGRTTFGKLQRERDKKAKALEKAEKKAARVEEQADAEPSEVQPATDQQAILEALAELHQRFEDGAVSIDDFEERRDQLTSRLSVD